jgi:hypothetical protein
MQRIKFDESEILDAFYTKAMADGMLDKPAENLYPDFDISAPPKNELDGIVAVASHDNRLYGLGGETGEEMVGKAHPGGGTVIDLDNNKPKDKDMAKVETIVERQKAMRDVAEGKPTGKLAQAMAKLVSLANLLDERGEHAAAAELDVEIAKLAADVDQTPVDGMYDGMTMGAPAPRKAPSDVPLAPGQEQGYLDDVAKAAEREAKAKADKAARLKANNARVITLLNQLREAEGLSPLAASPQAGVITKEVKDEMARSVSGGYSTWRELFSHLEKRVAEARASSALNAVQTTFTPGSPVARRGDEPGAPASIPTPQVERPRITTPQKGPPRGPSL